jgi:hypothetical protein
MEQDHFENLGLDWRTIKMDLKEVEWKHGLD